MKTKSMILSRYSATIATLLVASGASQAAITAINNSFFGGSAPGASVTQSIAVGSGADMLVVTTSAEVGGTVTSPMTVTYGGVAMNLASGNLTNSAIWYLDLSTPGISGTNVTVNLAGYSVRNGFAAGWVSLEGNLGVGESIGVHSTNFLGGTSGTVDLTTTEETFNVVNFNGNNPGSTVLSVVSPNPTVIYTDTDIGSAFGAAAFQAGIAAGTSNYQWNVSGGTSVSRRLDAAAFAVIPEPSAALLGGLGVLALLRRRRA